MGGKVRILAYIFIVGSIINTVLIYGFLQFATNTSASNIKDYGQEWLDFSGAQLDAILHDQFNAHDLTIKIIDDLLLEGRERGTVIDAIISQNPAIQTVTIGDGSGGNSHPPQQEIYFRQSVSIPHSASNTTAIIAIAHDHKGNFYITTRETAGPTDGAGSERLYRHVDITWQSNALRAFLFHNHGDTKPMPEIGISPTVMFLFEINQGARSLDDITHLKFIADSDFETLRIDHLKNNIDDRVYLLKQFNDRSGAHINDEQEFLYYKDIFGTESIAMIHWGQRYPIAILYRHHITEEIDLLYGIAYSAAPLMAIIILLASWAGIFIYERRATQIRRLIMKRLPGTNMPVDTSTNDLDFLEATVFSLIDSLKEKEKDLSGKISEQATLLFQTQSRLRIAERLSTAGEIVSFIGHDINQHVMIIKLLTERMTMDDGNGASYIPQITEAAQQISSIIANIKAMTDDEQTFIPIDINAAANEACHFAKALAAQKGIILKSDIDPDLHSIRGTPTSILQIITNLTTNAIKAVGEPAMPNEEYIRIQVKNSESHIEIKVLDKGRGISRNLDDIFRLFETGNKNDGSGLGLAITQRLVHHMGGTIEARPDIDGYATGMIVKIPKAEDY